MELTELTGDGCVEYPATPDAVASARRRATEFAAIAGASADTRDRVALAVSEAVGNAVLHAYLGSRAGRIELDLALDDLELVVYVRDWGRGMAAWSRNPGLGLGLTFIADSADQLELSSGNGLGTEVRMRFRLRPA